MGRGRRSTGTQSRGAGVALSDVRARRVPADLQEALELQQELASYPDLDDGRLVDASYRPQGMILVHHDGRGALVVDEKNDAVGKIEIDELGAKTFSDRGLPRGRASYADDSRELLDFFAPDGMGLGQARPAPGGLPLMVVTNQGYGFHSSNGPEKLLGYVSTRGLPTKTALLLAAGAGQLLLCDEG